MMTYPMGVPQCRFDIRMSEVTLKNIQRHARFKLMSRISVPQGVYSS
ncbi:hypothetical protein MED222_05445 [Vibrio sp. MED222]|nr:hypothetical protein MED222_05445 [Vibrio sp. MED222]